MVRSNGCGSICFRAGGKPQVLVFVSMYHEAMLGTFSHLFIFPLFLVAAPLKMVQAQKKVPFFFQGH